jgi:uncharacterized protein (TIGR00730 family)
MKYVCVFCGSSQSAGEAYDRAVEAFATACLEREIGLVYGGADSGTMGTLADTMLSGGGDVIGVIPESILERETPHQSLTRLEQTDTKAKRKERMAELADGFVALPGGLGTQEELFTALGQAKHGIHEKPCGYLNVAGYYDAMVEFLDHAVDAGFISPTQRQLLLVDADPGTLLDSFEEYESPIETSPDRYR